MYDEALGLFADDATALMHSGARVSGRAPAFLSSWFCCWECLTASEGYQFEDVRDGAAWESTVGLVEPWLANEPSPLLKIPSRTYLAYSLWKRDPFHAFKQTLGGHFGASTLMLFGVAFSLWKCEEGKNDVDILLQRAFWDFLFRHLSGKRPLSITGRHSFDKPSTLLIARSFRMLVGRGRTKF